MTVGSPKSGALGVLLCGFLLLLSATDDRIAQQDGQKEDPARCNQEEEPEKNANDESHDFSYEHLPCHAQCPSHQNNAGETTRIAVS